MFYFAKTPWWLPKIYPGCIWGMPQGNNTVYLSFDDGPHPIATAFVLEQLKIHQATATFFCIGKNVEEHPYLYERILDEGHRTGNHTYSHLNGWKTPDKLYLDDVGLAQQRIDTTLFRPPYGKATRFQLQLIKQRGLTPVMWTVLSGDFDATISKEKCLKNVLHNITDGSVIVFHDSEKALDKLTYALPRVLDNLAERQFKIEKLQC